VDKPLVKRRFKLAKAALGLSERRARIRRVHEHAGRPIQRDRQTIRNRHPHHRAKKNKRRKPAEQTQPCSLSRPLGSSFKS
jgi:hypothetical protein